MPIQFQTALLPNLISDSDVAQSDVTIVIDTLRFTTTAAQALASGAYSLRAVAEIAAARKLADAAAQASRRVRLCGERHCKPIEGFHLGNSPTEYTPGKVKGCELVFTTTNGTRAVQKARHCAAIFLGAITNRRALCEHIGQQFGDSDKRVTFICSGTDGNFTSEDLLAAGAIMSQFAETHDTEHRDDSSCLAHNSWRHLCDQLPVGKQPQSTNQKSAPKDLPERICSALANSQGGQNLINAGYESDLAVAADIDSCDAIPFAGNDAVFRKAKAY